MGVNLSTYYLIYLFTFLLTYNTSKKSFPLLNSATDCLLGRSACRGCRTPEFKILGKSIHWIWSNNLGLLPSRAAADSETSEEGALGRLKLSWDLASVHLQGFCCRDSADPALPPPTDAEEMCTDSARGRKKKSVSRSVVSDSWRPRGLQPARLLCPWSSPGKNTGVGSHSLLLGHGGT